ncbi:MAG TPA: aspartate-semialdehyde dehydrogenase [Bacteroidales bacterium]|nr:aspartate-semialdehyde dehydrogenase [Bacteroidales bacterium]HRX98382.1 aspartate-semialdehyde dehydrogenase [Bacteroidales bacterium]
MKVAVVGATGLVGRVMLQILEERNFNVTELIPVASEKSVGKKVKFHGKEIEVTALAKAVELKPDIALFSAGGTTSLDWAPKFAEKGTYVIDNSSAWRMDPETRLVVPEINAQQLTQEDRIIANPNCSTIQLVMALAPLHKAFKIKRLVISTYQSVSGSGIKAVKQMESERQGEKADMFYQHPIDKNCIPQCDMFADLGYTKEEWKLINETRKILSDPDIKITSTCVRVPVDGGHSESVNIQFEEDYRIEDIYKLLLATPGITVQDNPMIGEYPMPLNAKGKDDVFVGRVRRDFSQKHGLNMWIVSDNLRKGAATNAVQIAEYVAEKLLG